FQAVVLAAVGRLGNNRRQTAATTALGWRYCGFNHIVIGIELPLDNLAAGQYGFCLSVVTVEFVGGNAAQTVNLFGSVPVVVEVPDEGIACRVNLFCAGTIGVKILVYLAIGVELGLHPAQGIVFVGDKVVGGVSWITDGCQQTRAFTVSVDGGIALWISIVNEIAFIVVTEADGAASAVVDVTDAVIAVVLKIQYPVKAVGYLGKLVP